MFVTWRYLDLYPGSEKLDLDSTLDLERIDDDQDLDLDPDSEKNRI